MTIQNKIVVILGAGESGVGAAILAQKMGATVFVSDFGKIATDYKAELIQFGLEVDVFDPHADANQVKKEYNIELQQSPSKYDAIILAVSHTEFLKLNILDLKRSNNSIVYDIKGFLDRKIIDSRL